MTRIFVELPSFRSEWKAMGLTDTDLRRLQEELLADPKLGAVMKGTGGVRKMRFAFEDRGKSGSVRVIYVDFEVREKLYLLTAYPKNEKDNLSKSERNELKRLVEYLEDQLNQNGVKGDAVWVFLIRSSWAWKRLLLMSKGHWRPRPRS